MATNDPDHDAAKARLLAWATSPMPQQNVIELDACHAIDKLGFALQAARLCRSAALRAPDEPGEQATAAELRQRWIASNLLLDQAFGAVDASGDAVIQAVKTMLALA